MHFPLPSFHFPHGGILPSASSPPSSSQQVTCAQIQLPLWCHHCELQLPWQHEGFGSCVFFYWGFFPFFAFLISASSAVKDDLIWWSDLIDNFRCPLVNLCVAWNSFNIYSYSSPNPLIQACHATELRGFYSHGSQWRRDPLLPNCEPHFPPHCSYRDPCFPLSVFPFTVMGNNPAYLMIALLLVTFGWRSLPTLYITLLPYQTPPSLPTDWGIFRQFGFIHLVFF